MALAFSSDSHAAVLAPPSISSGGVLWRRGAGGEIEVCLARAGETLAIPRGAVLEDERLQDAAVRHLHSRTGRGGRIQRRFGRVTLGPGEFGYFFLFKSARDSRALGGSEWIPLPAAIQRVATDAERSVLLEALEALDAPASPARAAGHA